MTVEVMLNPDGRLWIDRLSQGLSDTGAMLSSADGERIVRLVAHHVGAEVHAARPRVSAELPETGERFEGLLPPVVTAPCFAIRKPAVAVFTLADYVASGIMTETQAALLRDGVAARANILVAGGTSTGKTTLTNALLAEVAGSSDRVVIIEDTRELQCTAPNLVALRTKDGVASLSDLVRSSLRLRPDRIPIFVTLIEFKLTTLAGFVLIPFGLFGKTAFMAERVLGNVVSSGIKVLVLAVIIGIGSTLFGQFTAGFGGVTPTIDEAMAIVLAALSLLGLGIFGPGIATGLVSGGPQLGAGAAVGTGLAVGGAAVAAGGGALLGARGAGALASGGAAATRGAAAATGAASTAYSLGSMGQTGPAGVASGLGGVGRAAGSAAASPLRRAAASTSDAVKASHADSARAGFAATGGTSSLGSAPGASAAMSAPGGTPPAWARSMRRSQAMSHGVSTATHALRAGDSPGSGASVSLSESDRP